MSKPCWNGIIPGITTVTEARRVLLAKGYTAGIVDDTLHYQYFYSNTLTPGCVRIGYLEGQETLSFVRLYCVGATRLGDAAASLGMPQSLVLQDSLAGGSEYISTAQDGDSDIVIGVGAEWKSVFSSINSIDIFQHDSFDKFQSIVWQWRGFIPTWRYCQFVPSYRRC